MAVLHNLLHSMDNEEYIDDAVVTGTEVDEATNSDENSYEETDSSDEIESLRKANAEIAARARKAEAELKKLKQAPQINTQLPEADELKLIARGLTDEEIAEAKAIAKGKGFSLLEATKDPLFLVYQKDLKEKERRENAKLGASKGSGTYDQKELIRPEMTREEHMEVFNKLNGR